MHIKSTTTEETIKKILRRDRETLKLLKKEIQHLKPGKIYIKHVGDNSYFYEYSGGKEKSITKQKEKVKNLARYEILKKQIEIMEHNCSVLEIAIRSMRREESKKIAELCELRDEPLGIYTKDQLRWLADDYDKNPYHPENLRYITGKGVKVRSKSERIIGNRLEALGIAYRYEPRMTFANRTIFPDFVILMSNGQKIIWEHFGLMEDEDYKQNAYSKIDIYRKHGYLQHKNLVCTWEEDIQDTQNIDEIITRFTHY